jgi:hypothetical protein
MSWAALAFCPTLLSAATNTVTALPNPESVFNEANYFFTQHKQAVRQLREKRNPEAMLTLNLLARNLKSSPWLEIALLKQSELVEVSNETFAMDNYNLLLQRLQNSPYFQGTADKARLFTTSLQGAVHNGINRIRARRIRLGLDHYFVRYREYPESLAKLAILGYTEIENIHTMDQRPFRYVPTGQQLTPFLSYKRYEGLDAAPPEPFLVTTPRLESTSRASDEPLTYAATMKVPGQREPVRIVEDQNVSGFLVVSITPEGVILCNDRRILVLLLSD